MAYMFIRQQEEKGNRLDGQSNKNIKLNMRTITSGKSGSLWTLCFVSVNTKLFCNCFTKVSIFIVKKKKDICAQTNENNACWHFHSLYIVIYILIFLHGHARLVQVPLWPWYFLGPVVLFVLDKLVSISRNKVLLPVHKATLLPSGMTASVTKLALA